MVKDNIDSTNSLVYEARLGSNCRVVEFSYYFVFRHIFNYSISIV